MSNETVFTVYEDKIFIDKEESSQNEDSVASRSLPLMLEVMLLTLIYSVRAYCLPKQHSFTYML